MSRLLKGTDPPIDQIPEVDIFFFLLENSQKRSVVPDVRSPCANSELEPTARETRRGYLLIVRRASGVRWHVTLRTITVERRSAERHPVPRRTHRALLPRGPRWFARGT